MESMVSVGLIARGSGSGAEIMWSKYIRRVPRLAKHVMVEHHRQAHEYVWVWEQILESRVLLPGSVIQESVDFVMQIRQRQGPPRPLSKRPYRGIHIFGVVLAVRHVFGPPYLDPRGGPV